MHTNTLTILFLTLFTFSVSGQSNYNLKKFPEGKMPQEIGMRIAEKFLNTSHSLYGNTKPTKPPKQITYPDVCTWLGGMWFAEATKNKKLFSLFEGEELTSKAQPCGQQCFWGGSFGNVSTNREAKIP